MEKERQKRVVVFTSPSCHWCKVAKNYFREKEIKYRAIDVTRDKNAARDCQNHGCRGVPVVLIGSRWICGFDKSRIDKELGIKG